MKPIEFTKDMKILSISYNKDFDEETINHWYKYFKNINKDIFSKAVNKVIANNKYMPSIAELLDICNKEQKNIKVLVLERMKNDNYFKTTKEYEKAIKWLDKDINPEWLLNDMKNYFINNQKLLGE